MTEVRELPAGETALAYPAMAELRPHLASREEFVRLVDQVMRDEGYRLVAAFDPDALDATGAPSEDAVAVAGFRVEYLLARGRNLYVDDLSTMANHRRRGHADALFAWMVEEAGRLECDELHLDSAVHRHDAHRFYLTHGMRITAHHFVLELTPR